MNDMTTERGIQVRMACHCGDLAITLSKEEGHAAMLQLARLPANKATAGKALAQSICHHIRDMIEEGRESEESQFERSPGSIEALKFGIAIMTLGLLSEHREVKMLIEEQFKAEAGTIAVHLRDDTLSVKLDSQSWSWNAEYGLGEFDPPITRH